MRGSIRVSAIPSAAAVAVGRRPGTLVEFLQRARRSPPFVIGAALFLGVLLMAALAPVIGVQDPIAINIRERLAPPSVRHLFGTDDFGRDVFSRVVWGSQLAVRLGTLSVLVAVSGGIVLGLVAGYYGGWVDQLISRIFDLIFAFPYLLFAIAIVAILGPSLDNLVVALGLFGWAGFGRVIRGSVLSARQREYVEAARAVGARPSRIMARHILPNVVAPVIILSATRFGGALLAGSGLSFIGLGVPIPQPEWGAIMATGRDYMGTAWWVTVFPGALIALAVLGVNLLGDGLRDLLDPRLRDA
ncbi:MAG TPA: ABC transporter permease [Candidatus Limnocylindria bacterium]|jgi:peptide/nickel transport system permease protein|nr:ABC transporter permease [Candidatus Limnocylindria bacterium]